MACLRFPVSLLSLLIVLCGAAGAELRPQRDGVVATVDYRTPEFTAAGTSPLRWSVEIKQIGSHFLRLRLSDVHGPADAKAVLKLRDRNGRLIREYPASELLREKTLWTPVIPGDYVLVSLHAEEPPLGFGMSIDRLAYQALAGARLSTIGDDEKDPIALYADDPLISRVERPVAKLSFLKAGELYTCTGFLIESGDLMTNHHCVASEALCNTTSVVFGYQFDQNSFLNFGEQYACAKVLKQDFELDYAILQLTGDPASSWGTLKLSAADPAAERPIFIIQHPSGQPKMISKRNCLTGAVPVNGRGADTDFTHMCDTAGGSSGAPIFNEDGEVIGLHHFGINDEGEWTENRGVRMLKIHQSAEPGTGRGGTASFDR